MSLQQNRFIKEQDLESNQITEYGALYWYFTHNIFVTILQVRKVKPGTSDLPKATQVISGRGTSRTGHSFSSPALP